jgi:hypothetical protein
VSEKERERESVITPTDTHRHTKRERNRSVLLKQYFLILIKFPICRGREENRRDLLWNSRRLGR